jgi:hypothetical protein
MKLKHAAILLCLCVGSATAQAPTGYVHTDEIAWGNAGAYGPGTSSKAVFTKDSGVFLDDLLRGMWVVKVDPGGQVTATTSPKEDLAFFVSKGTGNLSWERSRSTRSPATHTAFPPVQNTGSSITAARRSSC